jgi:hypothetical protein
MQHVVSKVWPRRTDDVVHTIIAEGGRARFIVADVQNVRTSRVREKVGRRLCLVNKAGSG